MRWWISGFHKMLGSSRVAAQLAASREGLGSMSENVFSGVNKTLGLSFWLHSTALALLPGEQTGEKNQLISVNGLRKEVDTTAGWKERVYAIFIALCCRGKTLKPFFFFSGSFITMFVHRDPKCMQLLLISAKYNGNMLILRTFVLNLLQK
jgi:hypothetical protein